MSITKQSERYYITQGNLRVEVDICLGTKTFSIKPVDGRQQNNVWQERDINEWKQISDILMEVIDFVEKVLSGFYHNFDKTNQLKIQQNTIKIKEKTKKKK